MNTNSTTIFPDSVHTNYTVVQKRTKSTGAPLQPLNRNLGYQNGRVNTKLTSGDSKSSTFSKILPAPQAGTTAELPQKGASGLGDFAKPEKLYVRRETFAYEESWAPLGYLEDDLDSIPAPPPPPPPATTTAPPYPTQYPPVTHGWHTMYDYHRRAPQPFTYSQYPGHAQTMQPRSYQPAMRPVPTSVPAPLPSAPFQQSLVAPVSTVPASSPGDLQQQDIVCGRGAPTNYHYGNQIFKDIIEDHQTSYLCAKRSDKPHIAFKIYDLIKASGSRFVRRDKAAGQFCWTEIDRKGAYDKICQALRDGAPDLRRQVLQSASKPKGNSKAKSAMKNHTA